MPAALFISPHLDDAVFSAGGTMAGLADAGWRVVLATVFTRSVPGPAGFALRCQTDKGLSPDVDYMALRRAEDAAAAAAVGVAPADVRWLGLPEAPHRGYHSAADLFAGVHPDDDPTTAAVADAIAPMVAAADAVFAPVGIGDHVDHAHVVRAVATVTAGRPVPAARWLDAPYLLRLSTPPPATHRVDLTRTLSRKLDGCAAYATQLAFQFGGPGAMRDRLVDVPERLRADPADVARLGLRQLLKPDL